MNSRLERFLPAVVFGTLLAMAGVPGAADAQTSSPQGQVKQLGRTVMQYKDGVIHLVIGYRYSSTHLDEPWMLLDTNLTATSGKAFSVAREDVLLITPDGKELTLPSQKTFGKEFTDIQRVLQAAKPSRDPITGYFPSVRFEERLPFFTVPGQGTVRDEFSASFTYLISGDLYFQSPKGKFDPGLYTLVIKNKDVDVKLPFQLPGTELKKEEKDVKTVPW